MRFLILLFLTLALSCGKDPNTSFFSNSKVIYGEDDRLFTHHSKDLMAKELARSTFAMIDRKLIKNSGYNSVTITGHNTPFCPGEPFAESMLAPTCSGFLVGPDILVTAGHCVKHADSCEKKKWVLDFREDLRSVDKSMTLAPNKIFHCKEIILKKFTGVGTDDDDFAIIRLDRKVDRIPLKFRTEGKISDFAETEVIGHPIGLPQIITPFGRILRNNAKKRFYQDADVFGGNSGGAVIEMHTGVVEGILVTNLQGKDFVKDEVRKCLKMGYVSEIGGPPPAGIYRITEISNYLTSLLGVSLTNIDFYPKDFWNRLFDEDPFKLKRLIYEGLDINTLDDHGEGLLHWAVRKEKPSMVSFLVEKGINLDHQDHYKESPIFYAARMGSFPTAKYLIDRGANIDIKNRDKAVVFHVAAGAGNIELVQYLLGHGADINALDNDNNTALIYASSYGQPEVAKILLESPGISVTAANVNRVNALIASASKGHTEIFKMVLNHPQTWNVNIQDNDGSTPLIFASATARIDIVRLLLKRPEIEVNKRNFHGQSALFWAQKKGHREIERLLINAGAR